jgi:hypothetical protein
MKRLINNLLFVAGQVKQRYLPWIIFVLILAMLVIGGGAPGDGGGAGCPGCP